jgi:predicted nucleotidyltransferase
MILNKKQEIIKILFKDLQNKYNSRSMSKIVNMSHVGVFKIFKKLEKQNIVNSERMGNAVFYSLNLKNPVACKEVESILTTEAQDYARWLEEFRGLEEKADVVMLFGSILKDDKSTRDIDLLVVAQKNKFSDIKKVIGERNEVSYKKIHLILQNPDEFKKDVYEKNKVIIEVIKTGVVLFGQDNARRYIR